MTGSRVPLGRLSEFWTCWTPMTGRPLLGSYYPACVPCRQVGQEKHHRGRNKHAATPPVAFVGRLHKMFGQDCPERKASQQAPNVSRVVDSWCYRTEEQVVSCETEQALQRALHGLPGNWQMS